MAKNKDDKFAFINMQREQSAIVADCKYENTVFRRTIAKLRSSVSRRDLQAIEEQAVEGLISAEIFYGVLYNFPVRLKPTRLSGIQLHLTEKAFLPALFHKFEQAPFVKPFVDFYAECLQTHFSIGLVFPRRGFSLGMILHNVRSRVGNSPHMVVPNLIGEDAYLQSYESFLDSFHTQTNW